MTSAWNDYPLSHLLPPPLPNVCAASHRLFAKILQTWTFQNLAAAFSFRCKTMLLCYLLTKVVVPIWSNVLPVLPTFLGPILVSHPSQRVLDFLDDICILGRLSLLWIRRHRVFLPSFLVQICLQIPVGWLGSFCCLNGRCSNFCLCFCCWPFLGVSCWRPLERCRLRRSHIHRQRWLLCFRVCTSTKFTALSLGWRRSTGSFDGNIGFRSFFRTLGTALVQNKLDQKTHSKTPQLTMSSEWFLKIIQSQNPLGQGFEWNALGNYFFGTCKTNTYIFSYNDMARPRPLPRPRPRPLPRPFSLLTSSLLTSSSSCVSSNTSFPPLHRCGWLDGSGGEIIKPAASREAVLEGGVALDWGILCRILAAMFTWTPAMLYEQFQTTCSLLINWILKAQKSSQQIDFDSWACIMFRFLRPWLKLNKAIELLNKRVKLSYDQFAVALQVSLTQSLAAPSHIWIHFRSFVGCHPAVLPAVGCHPRVLSNYDSKRNQKDKGFASSRCL